MKQPYATLICSGTKDVENRSWSTTHRGRIAIHATTRSIELFDRSLPLPIFREFDQIIGTDGRQKKIGKLLYVENDRLLLRPKAKDYRREFELLKTEIAEQIDHESTLFAEGAIVGECTLVDIIQDSSSSWSESGSYHWILADPILYADPIGNVKGHLKLWTIDDSILGGVRAPKTMVRR